MDRPDPGRIAALADRVGVTTYASYEQGLNTEFRDGRAHRFDGQLPDGSDPVSAVAMGQAIRELDVMAARVPLEAPWTAAEALTWDSQTVETWLEDGSWPSGPELAAGGHPGDAGRRGARPVAAAHPVRHRLGRHRP